MIDVTKNALRQSNDYGRPVRLNVTRVGNYVSKAERIFKLLGQNELKMRVEEDQNIVEFKEMTLNRIIAVVKKYGEQYFIDLYHRDGDLLIMKIQGEVSLKKQNEE